MTRRARPTLSSVIYEALAGLESRLGRVVLTVLGIAVGVAALVGSVGISQTSGARIVTRFYEQQETLLVATSRDGPLDPDIPDRASRQVAGIVSASYVNLHLNSRLVQSRVSGDARPAIQAGVQVLSAPAEAFAVASADVSGRTFDRGHVERGARVAMLGSGAARRLSIQGVDGRAAVLLDGRPVIVIGLIDDARLPELLDAVVLPESAARELIGPATATLMVFDTDRAATYQLAERLPVILSTMAGSQVEVSAPPPPPDVAAAISEDLDALTLALTGLGVVVAAISVGAIMTINVVERTAEIGLRRALGASRRSIALQFLLESIAMGVVGGASGATLGLMIVHTVALTRGTTPVLGASIPGLAVATGVLIGALAGVGPSVRAARIEPSVSLRS